jgi:hypothetical protein
MAIRSLRDRVEEAFDDERAREFGTTYIERILDTWQSVDRSLRRTVVLLAVAATAFQLLISANVTSVSFGPFKLADVSFATALIPALASYLLYEFVVLFTTSYRFAQLHGELVRKLHPTLYNNDLEFPLYPSVLSFWGDDAWRYVRENEEGWAGKVLYRATTAIGVGLLIAVGGFLVYAYWQLFDDSRASRLLIWGGLIFTLINVLRAVLTVADQAD